MCDIIYLYSASKHEHTHTNAMESLTREQEIDSNLRTHKHKHTFIQLLPLFAHLLYLRLHTWIEIPNISLFSLPNRVRIFFLFWRSQNVVAVHFEAAPKLTEMQFILSVLYKRQLIKGGKQQQSQHRKFNESLFVYPLLSLYRLLYFTSRTHREKRSINNFRMVNQRLNFFSFLGDFSANVFSSSRFRFVTKWKIMFIQNPPKRNLNVESKVLHTELWHSKIFSANTFPSRKLNKQNGFWTANEYQCGDSTWNVVQLHFVVVTIFQLPNDIE